MAISTAMELVQLCEDRLGWRIDFSDGVPALEQRRAEAGKINKLRRRDPKKLTWENLELALEYSWVKKIPILSPVALCYRVDDALKWLDRPTTVLTDLETRRLQAITDEITRDLPDAGEWIARLQRAEGDGVEVVLQELAEVRRVVRKRKKT